MKKNKYKPIKNKKFQYDMGSQIGGGIGSAIGVAIPGFGAIASPLLGMAGSLIGGAIDKSDEPKKNPDPHALAINSNPYGLMPYGGKINRMSKSNLELSSGLSPFSDEDFYFSPSFKQRLLPDNKLKRFKGEGAIPYLKGSLTSFSGGRNLSPTISGEFGVDGYAAKGHLQGDAYVGYNANGSDKGGYGGVNVAYVPQSFFDQLKTPIGISMSSDSKRGTLSPNIGFDYNPLGKNFNVKGKLGYDIIENSPIGSLSTNIKFAKGGWIQKAVNPKHKGFCTPMTKSTCTPKRKALAKTFKKHHGFHKEDGGFVSDIENNDLMQYNAGSHTSGMDQSVSPTGIPVQGEPNFIQNDENSFKGYVFSDTLVNPETGRTFNKDAKKIDKKMGGRKDSIAERTRNLAYSRLMRGNENERMKKAYASITRFEKKYGGKIMYAPGGGILPSPDINENINYDLPFLPTSNSPLAYQEQLPQLKPIDNWDFVNSTSLKDKFMNMGRPQNPVYPDLTTLYTEQRNSDPVNPDTSFLNSQTTQAREFSNNDLNFNWGKALNTGADILSPLFNTAMGIASIANKSKNYQMKASTDALNTLEQLPTDVPIQANLNANERSFRGASEIARRINPSTGLSMMSSNLAKKLGADNQIYQYAATERLNRIADKLKSIAAEKARINQFNQAGKYQYYEDNAKDKAMREDKAAQYFGATVNDIQAIKQDKDLGKIIPQAWKYYKWDPSTGNFVIKDSKYAHLFNLSTTLTKEQMDQLSGSGS